LAWHRAACTILVLRVAVVTAVGMLANTSLKWCLAMVLGQPVLRRVAGGGLFLLGVASAVGLWLGR